MTPVPLTSSQGILTAGLDPNGNQTTYFYADQDGDLHVDEITRITDPFGRSTLFGYTGASKGGQAKGSGFIIGGKQRGQASLLNFALPIACGDSDA